MRVAAAIHAEEALQKILNMPPAMLKGLQFVERRVVEQLPFHSYRNSENSISERAEKTCAGFRAFLIRIAGISPNTALPFLLRNLQTAPDPDGSGSPSTS